MLQEFIVANQDLIVERARQRAGHRGALESGDAHLENWIPLFLTQLTEAMGSASIRTLKLVGAEDSRDGIRETATLHGQEWLKSGFTVGQVVHGYGDVRQIVSELVSETSTQVSVHDFRIFNRCLDDAIAGAVSAYGRQRERDVAYEGTERLGVLASDLGNLLDAADLSFDIMKKHGIGIGGSTGAMHSRSLSELGGLLERSLAEGRLDTGEPRLKRISLVAFIQEIEVSAAVQAEALGLQLTVNCVDKDIVIRADWQFLASAVLNLLQNAFKFTRAHGKVSLNARATADRVFIDVYDECGGLPAGKAEELLRPLVEGSSSHSGLGLSIARHAARANAGDIQVRDIPGTGCVFTIDLPRQPG